MDNISPHARKVLGEVPLGAVPPQILHIRVADGVATPLVLASTKDHFWLSDPIPEPLLAFSVYEFFFVFCERGNFLFVFRSPTEDL